MKIALIITGFLILIVVGFRLYNSLKSKPKIQPSYIRLIIPLSDLDTFNQDDFVKDFLKTWQTKIVCGETNDLKKDNDKQRIYLLGNGIHNLMIKINDCPLSKSFTDVLIDASKSGFTANEPITDEQALALSSHKANLELEYMFGSDNKIDRVVFTSKLLISIFKHFKAIGFVNVSAQSFIPSSKLTFIMDKNDLVLTDVFNFFVNTQLVKSDNEIEVHTHGMEQFYLPDMILYSKDNLDINYNTNILRNACVYNIDNNNALKIGDGFHLTGFQEIFLIERSIPEKEHPFGAFGAVGLRKNKKRCTINRASCGSQSPT
jgi:hypothetical protein